MKQKNMETGKYAPNINSVSSKYTQLLRQYRINKHNNKIGTPTNTSTKINTSSRQSTNITQTNRMGKNGVELNYTNNTTAVRILNRIKYRKSQSKKDSNNRKKQTSKSLHSCKKSIIPSNDYSEEPNHKTNTNDNIINPERVSQLRRSHRLKK